MSCRSPTCKLKPDGLPEEKEMPALPLQRSLQDPDFDLDGHTVTVHVTFPKMFYSLGKDILNIGRAPGWASGVSIVNKHYGIDQQYEKLSFNLLGTDYLVSFYKSEEDHTSTYQMSAREVAKKVRAYSVLFKLTLPGFYNHISDRQMGNPLLLSWVDSCNVENSMRRAIQQGNDFTVSVVVAHKEEEFMDGPYQPGYSPAAPVSLENFSVSYTNTIS